LDAGLKSKTQIISEMGGDPRITLEEIEKEQNKEIESNGFESKEQQPDAGDDITSSGN
jgi:capsid protein